MSTDTHRTWGYIDKEGTFRPCPRWPACREMEPPFDVTLPSGEVRRIIWEPAPEAHER